MDLCRTLSWRITGLSFLQTSNLKQKKYCTGSISSLHLGDFRKLKKQACYRYHFYFDIILPQSFYCIAIIMQSYGYVLFYHSSVFGSDSEKGH